MTAVLTQRCNIKCEHCYLPSIDYEPGMTDDLSREDFEKTIKAVSGQFSGEVEEIYLTGGEFLLLSYARDIVTMVKEYFPSSKVYAYTNGLIFLKDPTLFDDVKPDYFHLGIDPWHGTVDENGCSQVAEEFIRVMKQKNDFRLIFHWTAKGDEDDRDVYEKFYDRYNLGQENLLIEYRPLNINIGRSAKYGSPKYEKAETWRKCSFANHVMIRFDRACYGCHWGIKSAFLGETTSLELLDQMQMMRNTDLYHILTTQRSDPFFAYLTDKYQLADIVNQCGICEKLVGQGINLYEEAERFGGNHK